MKKCSKCKELIQSHHIYCPNCGKENKSHSDRSAKGKKIDGKEKNVNQNQNYKIFAGIVVVIGIIVTIYLVDQNSYRNSKGEIVTTSDTNPMLNVQGPQISQDSDMYQVASYFECSCGDCQDHELVTCECPTAKSHRVFIQKHLDDGKSVEEVRVLVSTTFGKLKPEHKDSLDDK